MPLFRRTARCRDRRGRRRGGVHGQPHRRRPPRRRSTAPLEALPRQLTAAERGAVAASGEFSFAPCREPNRRNARGSMFISSLGASVALAMTVPHSDSGRTADAFAADFVAYDAFVDVNEEGTGAAGVTTSGDIRVSAPVYHQVRVDRPFLFAIREKLTRTVPFVGKVAKL